MKNKIYFASDFHLGIDAKWSSREREQQIVRWLDQIKEDAAAIYLVGDLFDFWFEYRAVVPKGFVRFLGKLAELRDLGIPIFVFIGNHDMWLFDYFEKEMDIPVIRKPVIEEIGGKRFYIGHGDGLGPGDHGYKMLKKIFANRLCQWLFARLHPNFSFWIAQKWSVRSRASNPAEEAFLGEEKEWLLIYANEQLEKNPADYYVFGHRHLPIDYTLKNGTSRYINLGEWMNYNSYAVFDGENVELKFFNNPEGKVKTNR